MFFFSFIFISITLFGRIYLLILKYFNDLIPLSFSHGLQDYISNIMWLGFRSSMASLMHYILDPSLLPEPAQILSAQKSTSFLSFKHFLSSNSMWFNISFMTAIFSYSSFFGLCVYVLSCSVTANSLWPHEGSLSMWFPRQEYWSGLPFPPPRDLPSPGIKSMSLASPALAEGFFTSAPPGKPFGLYSSTLADMPVSDSSPALIRSLEERWAHGSLVLCSVNILGQTNEDPRHLRKKISKPSASASYR